MERLKENKKFIIHLFPKEKFTDSYINFINKNFTNKDNIFFLYGRGYNTISENEENVFILKKDLIYLFKYLKLLNKSHGIILHSFFNKKIILTLLLQPWLMKKINIVFWGADLYCYRNKKVKFKDKVSEWVRKVIIKNVKYITTLVSGDYELAKRWYNVKGIPLLGMYLNIDSQENLERIRENKKRFNDSDVINIQIGNNADKSNNHIEAINLVSRFKEYNIKVYIPLSYSGTKEYISSVIDYGKNRLGNKFIPLLDYISIERYNEYLSTIDIGIFCNDRQQGMGNINSLVYLGSKIYLRNDTAMWKHFTEELNYSLDKVEDISDLSFEEFIRYNEKNMRKNIELVARLRSEANAIEKWQNIFKKMGMD